MLARISFITCGAAGSVIAVSSWQSSKVYAAESTSTDTPKKKIRPSELPIYGEPESVHFEYAPEWETEFHRKVSQARKWTWQYMDSIKDTTDKAQSMYDVAKAHSTDFLSYIHEDSSVLPRVAIITVSGLGGIVAGYRGGMMRKAFFAATGMTAASAVCYPREANAISKRSWDIVKDFAKTTYNDVFRSSTVKVKQEVKPVKSVKSNENTPPTSSPDVKLSAESSSDSPKMDFGMSKPEDKDMYTTRGS